MNDEQPRGDDLLSDRERGALKLEIGTFFDPETFTATHVLIDPATSNCAVVDSVLDFDPAAGRTSTKNADLVIAFVREQRLNVQWILETHAHADHLSAAHYLKEQLGGQVGIGEHIRTVQAVFGKVFNEGIEFALDGSQFDHLFADGEVFELGQLKIRVMHTPGHTPACVTYLVGDVAFVGDTLFMPDYGTARADFPGGDARVLFHSIRKVLSLPPETRILLCHDYRAPGRDQFVWETTVAAERAGNVHVHDGVTEDEFVAMRIARDAKLGMPRLILPSIQVNMRAGQFPPAKDNGTRYLSIPLNAL